MDVQLYNTKDHPIIFQKGTAVAQMVAANEVPEAVVAIGLVGTLMNPQVSQRGMHQTVCQRKEKGPFQET